MVEITKITGHLGDGKSLLLIMIGFYDYFAKHHVILCNFDLYSPIRSFKVSVSSLMNIIDRLNPDRRYTFLLDESNTEKGVESRESMSSENKEFGDFVSQVRKRNIDLYYVSQWKKGAETRLREKTDYRIKCHAIRDPNNEDDFSNVIAFYYRKYDEEDNELIDRWIVPVAYAKLYYPMYKTRQLFVRAR